MDWSGMLPELLAIIAQKHIVFYEDYYSFAGVSKSWHLAAIQAAKVHKFPNGPPSRFPSLMLAQKSKDKEFRELLLLSNKSIRKKSIRKIRLPQIYDKVFMTSCGWLVTVGEDFSSQLINPLSCETINLPKFNTFDPEYFLREDSWYGGIRKLILLTSNNQSTLVLPLVVVSWGWDYNTSYFRLHLSSCVTFYLRLIELSVLKSPSSAHVSPFGVELPFHDVISKPDSIDFGLIKFSRL
ncbi:hypothetical protein Tco_0952361 [Tanacetum coccineum]|uniref:KIB1-4 beta-propeller domain-containing protein n=1 Tax=Tanacetum coccineum TaxID=301880 RepID=A0ABQ5DWP8_9ASTR